MPQMPRTCSTVILWGALALGLASSLNAFAAKKIIPLQATTTEQTAEDVIYQMALVPTSNASTYLKNLTCANGVFGREIRYTIVKGSLAGHSKKQLFVRTYQTDANGYMRPWSTDNYRWHPFNAGQQTPKSSTSSYRHRTAIWQRILKPRLFETNAKCR